MSKTQGVLVTELRSRLNERAEAFFTDVELRTWINEGARDIARKTEALRAYATVSITANTQDYVTGPTDLIRIHRVEFTPTGSSQRVPLIYRDRSAMDVVWGTHQAITTSYWPEYYTTWLYPGTTAMQISLFPIPAVAGTLRVWYYKFPTALATGGSASATTLDIPEGWEDLILEYAEARAHLKRKDVTMYQVAWGNYGDKVMDLLETSLRYSDAAGQITPAFDFMPDDDWYC